MSETPRLARLAGKIAKMMGEVAGVQKRGWNPHHKYNYALSTDVYEATRELMARHNVILVQRPMLDHVERTEKNTRNGSTVHIKMAWEFCWMDADTGESIIVPWVSEAEDGQDKGANKAATAARKYFLVTQLQIPVDQDDADAGPTTGNGRQAAGMPPAAPEQVRNGKSAPAPAPQQERRVAQQGATREAPPTAYRDDEGRKALRKRAWDALVHYYADGAPADQAKVLVQAGLRGIVEDHPDMVAIVDGEPSLQGSNDQLQRLVAYVESLGKPGEDVPF